ncbi:SIR2 family NAD-dependent protein deacylase [Aquimarina agarilytica]|uniref:SIR2 family NAD-dependent protein deacylase n=1 Tax=Aquimarina agarilytica TaxID=1087449 RepID=UPI0002889064|nr:NAD-dependent deacylase [Aquimarina agarilytica]
MKHLVVLTGAGMSAESGINTFRDAGGLWEGHDVMEVASPEGFAKNPDLVYDFYNQRRKQLFEVEPNKGHYALAALEKDFEISIITQNVDDLHERAGSTNVIHLHGELRKARSLKNENYIVDWDADLTEKDTDLQGNSLRPHIVWFGEAVPMLDKAVSVVAEADVVLIIGTSLQVYPAASLFQYAPASAKIYYIDPNPATNIPSHVSVIKQGASKGLEEFNEGVKSGLI